VRAYAREEKRRFSPPAGRRAIKETIHQGRRTVSYIESKSALGAAEAVGPAATAVERPLAAAARPVGGMPVGTVRMTLAVAARGGVAALPVLALGAMVAAFAIASAL
jgi:hypothetical protein